jgi:hypothetical protein
MCEYLISINGGTPFNADDAGLTLSSITLRNLSFDVLETFLPAASFATVPKFATNDAVKLQRDGVTIFTGTAGNAEFDMNAKGWRQSIRGATQILEVQSFYLSGNDPVSPSLFNLGEPNWGINTRFEWGLIKEWCGRASNRVSPELQLAPWPSSLAIQCPDSSHLFPGAIMDNIRAVLGGYLTACTRVDYTTNPPTLSIAHRGDDVVEFDAFELQGGSITLRSDLWPRQLRTRATADSPSDLPSEIGLMIGNNYYSVDFGGYPASPASDGRGDAINWLNITNDTGILVWSTIYDQAGYNVLRTPVWEGSIAVSLQDCLNRGVRPGVSLNITNGVDAWSTMQATVQNVQMDLIGQTATLELGIPGTLDSSTIISLLLTFARRTKGFVRTIPRVLE